MQYIFGISFEDIGGAFIILFFTLPLGIAFYITLLFKQNLKIQELFFPDFILFFLSLVTPPGKPSNEFLSVDNRGLMGCFFICILSAQILAIIVYLAVKLIRKIRKAKTKIKEKKRKVTSLIRWGVGGRGHILCA
jgi:hypothetical protein